jgi:hypothetical protein
LIKLQNEKLATEIQDRIIVELTEKANQIKLSEINELN